MPVRRLLGFARALCCLVVYLACLAPRPAMANGLPVRMEAVTTGMVVAADDVPVAILKEELTIDLGLPPRGGMLWDAEARVRAVYRLENRSRERQELEVAFLGWGLGSRRADWQVRLAGKTLAVREHSSPSVAGLTPPWPGLDPFTGERYQPRHSTVGTPQAVFFPLVLEAGERADLEVSYVGRCGYDTQRYVNPLFHFNYLLSPARHWADFGYLEVRVRVPQGVRVASNLPLSYWQGDYVGTFGDLPGEELTVAYISTDGMWFGRYTNRMTVWLAMLVALLTAAGLLRFLGGKAPGWGKIATQLCVLGATAWFLHVNLGKHLLDYPFSMVQPLLRVLVWLAALVYGVRLWRGCPVTGTPAGPDRRISA